MKKITLLLISIFAIFGIWQINQIQTLKAENKTLKQEIIDYRVELIPFEKTDYFITHDLGIIDDKELLFSYNDLLGDEYTIFFYNQDCRASQQVAKEIHKTLLKRGDIPTKIYFIDMQKNRNFAANENSKVDKEIDKDNFAIFVTPSFLTYNNGTYTLQSGYSVIHEILGGEINANN